MTLQSFSVERYRGFKERTEIKIRPLTLLFGYNSAGKSALLRFLPLIRDTILAGSAPIQFESKVVRGATFSELHCRLSGKPTIAFEFESGNESARYEIRDLGREERQTVEFVTRQTDASTESLEWTTEANQYLASIAGSDPEELTVNFTGLTANGRLSGGEFRWEIPAATQLRNVQWLGSVRAQIPRFFPFGPRHTGPLNSDGRDAPSHLAFAHEDRTTVFKLVQEFYRDHLKYLLEVRRWAERFRLQVSPVETPTLGVDLTDTGAGLGQVLPVAVAVARAATPEGPHLLAIEQPELHLHPALHSALAKWCISVIHRAPKARLILETHSEVLLLSTMLAVAKGEIKPEQVLVYWVHQLGDGQSVVEEVTLDNLARLSSQWPRDVFQEDSSLAAELNRLRLQKLRP